MEDQFDQEDPLGILDKKKSSNEDPLGILKKKADGVGSLFGARAGTSVPQSVEGSVVAKGGASKAFSTNTDQSEEKQKLTDFIYNLKTPEQKAQSKPTTKPIVASSKPFKKDEKPFDQTREEYVETATNKLNDIMYGEGDEWKDPIGSSVKGIKKSESVKDALGYHGAMNLTESSLMSDGFEANRVLNSTLLGQAGNDNMTANVLKKKATEYNNATKAFNNIQDLNFLDWAKRDEFYNAAMQFYAEKNPHFKAQAEVAGLPTVENNAKRGQIVAQVMSDPDFIAYATKQNPAMMPLIQDVQEKFYQENKDYAANVIANKVSQAMEKGGYNKIDPIFNFAGENAREVADLTAQSELTPEEYQIYKEKNVFDKLDMPSFFEGFATTAKDIGESTKNTFATWFKPMSQSVKESWNKEANHVSAEPKGYTAWFRDVGGVAGLVSTIGMTTGITGGAASATILNFLGQEIENKKAEFPDKPVTAITLGSINTLLYAMLSKDLFPAAKVKSAFTSVQPELKNVVEKFTSGKISQEAARKELQTTFKKVTDFVTGTAAKNTKVSLELAGIQGINRVMDRLAGMDKQRFEELHPDSEIADGIVHTFSTFAPISALGKYGELKNRNRVVEETIYDAVSNPKRTERLINEAEMNLSFGTANEIKANFKVALDAKTELDALKINPKEQKRFIFEALKEKAAKDAMEASSDPVIKKKNSEIVKEAQEIKEKILNGEDADTIVTEKEQKIIDEQKEKEIELQRLEKDHEFELKKFDEDRSKLDGRVPEDKIKIERLEEDKKRAIEDFERKSGKLKPKEEPVELLDQERELDMGDKELTEDESLLEEVRSKSGEQTIVEELPFFIEQTANDPVQAIEKYGEETANTLLSKATDKQLTKAAVNLGKFDKNNPGIDILNKELERREGEAETKIEEPTVSSAVIEIGGKLYEGKNHAEAILKAKADGQDISRVNRQAQGKFKLSDGTIIDRAEAKKRFGQDRSELMIEQDAAAEQANKDYRKITDPKQPTVSETEGAGADVYVHETDSVEFENFDKSKIGSGQGEAWLGEGIYLQKEGTFKLETYGKNKVKATLKPSAKIFKSKDTPNGTYRDSFVEWAVNNTETGKRKADERIEDDLPLDNLLPRDILKRNPEVVDKLKEQGYDGLEIDGELVVYNPEVLEVQKKTKAEGAGSSGVGDFTAKGGNKVVDDKGEPLEVYHGTSKAFDDLDANKPQRGLFFTSNKKTASSYANTGGDNPRIISVNLNLKNPHIIDAKGKSYDNILVDLNKAGDDGKGVSKVMSTDEIVEALRGMRSESIVTNLYGTKTKADGIIIKNVKDALTNNLGDVADIYIPFSNEQVKNLNPKPKAEDKAPVTKPEGKSDVVVDKASNVGGDVERNWKVQGRTISHSKVGERISESDAKKIIKQIVEHPLNKYDNLHLDYNKEKGTIHFFGSKDLVNSINEDIGNKSAQKIKIQQEADAANKSKAEKEKSQLDYINSKKSESDWIDNTFGEGAIGNFNKIELIKYLSGESEKFVGSPNRQMQEGLERIGAIKNGNVDFKQIKKAYEQSLSKQESGGKAPVTKPEGKSDVVDKASNVGGDVESKQKEARINKLLNDAIEEYDAATDMEKKDLLGKVRENVKSLEGKSNMVDGAYESLEAGKRFIESIDKNPKSIIGKDETLNGIDKNEVAFGDHLVPLETLENVALNFKKMEGENTSGGKGNIYTKADTENAKKQFKDDVKYSIDEGHYQELIKSKEVSTSDVIKIIESAGLEVPKDISKQSLSKQESGGKAPVTKPEGKSDVVDKASNVGGDVERTAKAVSKRVAVEHAGHEGAKRVTGANENTLELDGYGTVSTSQFINTLVENGRLPKDALKNRHIQLTDEYATKLLNENSDLFPKENTTTNKNETDFPTFESAKNEYDAVKEKYNKHLKKDGGLRANTPDNVKKEIEDAYTKMQSMVKQERNKRVSEDKRDTGLIDGIERIKDNTSAFTLVRMAMNRGVIPERQYNEFGKNLLHIIADAKDSHEVTMQTAEIIQDFSQRANVKVDDALAREIQAAENLKYEPVEQSLSKQESGGKAPVTKPEGKSDVVGNQQKVETKRVEKVAELEAERDMAILREGKPEVKMEFVTAKELVDSKDPIGNKKIHTDIKDRYKKMRELLDCLWT